MENGKKQGVKNKGNTLSLDMNFLGAGIFLVFQIPLTNIIGNEGNGYLAVSMELYLLFGVLFGHSISGAVSEMVRKRVRKNQYQGSLKVLTLSAVAGVVLSLLGMISVYMLSNPLLAKISMRLSGISLRLLAVLFLFHALAGVLRGYFEGMGSQVPTSFSKVAEAFVAGTGGLLFAASFKKYGSKVGALLFETQYEPAFGAAGAAVGCLCGGFLTVVFLVILYRLYQKPLKQRLKKDMSAGQERRSSLLAEFGKLYLLGVGELLLFRLFRIGNMVNYIQSCVGTDGEKKMMQYIGSYHGKALVLTGIAIVLVLVFTGSRMRRIQRLYYKNEYKLCWKFFCEDIKQIAVFSVPIAIIMAAAAKGLCNFLYRSAGSIEVQMIQIGCINIVLVPLAIYLYRLLRRLDQKVFLLIFPLPAFALQYFAVKILVKQEAVGALSMMVGEVLFWFVMTVLEVLVSVKVLKRSSRE